MNNKKKENKKNKRKIRFRGLLIVILFCYLIFSCGYYLYSKPIQNININGNKYLKDNYLIDYIDIKDTSIIKLNKKKIKNKLLELDIISDVEIKKNILGTLTIKVQEERALFYDYSNNSIILSNGKEIEYDNNYLGIPTLINYVPEDILEEFIHKLKLIDDEVLSIVSEIEYSPSMINDKVVDEKRFLFRMNDGNKVYINTINIEKFNNYLSIYEAVTNVNENVNGCLYLDSNSGDNLFNDCSKDIVVEEDTSEDEL